MSDNAKAAITILGLFSLGLLVALMGVVFSPDETPPTPDPYHRELVTTITEAHVIGQGLPREPSSREKAAVDIVAFAKAIEEADE